MPSKSVEIVIKKTPNVKNGLGLKPGQIYKVSEAHKISHGKNEMAISVKVSLGDGRDVWLIPSEYELLKQ